MTFTTFILFVDKGDISTGEREEKARDIESDIDELTDNIQVIHTDPQKHEDNSLPAFTFTDESNIESFETVTIKNNDSKTDVDEVAQDQEKGHIQPEMHTESEEASSSSVIESSDVSSEQGTEEYVKLLKTSSFFTHLSSFM